MVVASNSRVELVSKHGALGWRKRSRIGIDGDGGGFRNKILHHGNTFCRKPPPSPSRPVNGYGVAVALPPVFAGRILKQSLTALRKSPDYPGEQPN